MHIVQSRRALVLVTSAAVAAGIGLGVAPAAQAANGKVTIANTLPRWLGQASKSAVTPFAATTQTVRVYLTPNGGADALDAAVAAVSDPSSAQYRQFLTTAQYDATYAPTQAQVDQVSGYLSGAGLAVTGVEAHHRYVEASGTTSQLGSAFGVQLGTFASLGVQKNGAGFGLLNPLLYSAPAGAITDVRPAKDLGVVRVDYANGFDGSAGLLYSVRTFNQDSSLTTTKGWDTVTGLGVPNPKLLAAIPSAR